MKNCGKHERTDLGKTYKAGRLLLSALLLIGVLTACGGSASETAAPGEKAAGEAAKETETPEENKETDDGGVSSWRESVQQMFEDPYGDYRETGGEIALLTAGAVEDGGYNEAVYNGVRMYALGAGVSFSCYYAEEYDLESHREAVARAVEENARLIVCAGDLFGMAVGALQEAYPQISFLLVDSAPCDEEREELPIADNVHCIKFHEEQAGYLAGYMAVWEGYHSLGFMAVREEPEALRYGYGYLQGIDAAAKDLSLEDVTVHYGYTQIYSPGIAARVKAAEWYEGGVQVIFACGDGLYESVLEAAEEQDGLLIGMDVDMSRVSGRFLTSAVKNIATAVTDALDSFYANGGWNEAEAGQMRYYGVEEGCAAIPVVDTEWRFKELPTTHFFEIYKQMKRGDRAVSDEIGEPPQMANATVIFE